VEEKKWRKTLTHVTELLTSSHPEETVQQAVAFAKSLTGDFKEEVQVLEL
jgi:hypothetical protein